MNTTTTTQNSHDSLTAERVLAICHDALLPEGVTVARRRTAYKIRLCKDGVETWQDVLGFTIYGLGVEVFYYPEGRSITHVGTGKAMLRTTGNRVGAKYNVFAALWNLRGRLTGSKRDSFRSAMLKLESPEALQAFLTTLDTWQSPTYVQ